MQFKRSINVDRCLTSPMMKSANINIVKIPFLSKSLAKLLNSVTPSSGEAGIRSTAAPLGEVYPPFSWRTLCRWHQSPEPVCFDLAVLTLGTYPAEILAYFFQRYIFKYILHSNAWNCKELETVLISVYKGLDKLWSRYRREFSATVQVDVVGLCASCKPLKENCHRKKQGDNYI